MDSEDIKKHITPELQAKWEVEAAQLRAGAASVIEDLVDEYNRLVGELFDLRKTILMLGERYERGVDIPAITTDSAVAWETDRARGPDELGRELADAFERLGMELPVGYAIDELADGWCARTPHGEHLGRFPAHRDARVDAWTDVARRSPTWAEWLLTNARAE